MAEASRFGALAPPTKEHEHTFFCLFFNTFGCRFLRRRYFLSKAWAGNLRRYVEAQARRRRSPLSSSPNSAGKEKRRRGRERAESNLMPPWPDVNADITCHHGGLAHSPQGTRCKVCQDKCECFLGLIT